MMAVLRCFVLEVVYQERRSMMAMVSEDGCSVVAAASQDMFRGGSGLSRHVPLWQCKRLIDYVGCKILEP